MFNIPTRFQNVARLFGSEPRWKSPTENWFSSEDVKTGYNKMTFERAIYSKNCQQIYKLDTFSEENVKII